MNDVLIEITGFISKHIIPYTPLLIAIIIAVQYYTKNEEGTGALLHAVCWLFIALAIITLLELILHLEDLEQQEVFRLRVMGPYWWAYWTMMFCHSVLPLLLLFRKLRSNKYLILLISILLNIGAWFEKFVIIMSLHRDYIPEL